MILLQENNFGVQVEKDVDFFYQEDYIYPFQESWVTCYKGSGIFLYGRYCNNNQIKSVFLFDDLLKFVLESSYRGRSWGRAYNIVDSWDPGGTYPSLIAMKWCFSLDSNLEGAIFEI